MSDHITSDPRSAALLRKRANARAYSPSRALRCASPAGACTGAGHGETRDRLEHSICRLHLVDDDPADPGNVIRLHLRDDVELAGDGVHGQDARLALQLPHHLQRFPRRRRDQNIRTDHVAASPNSSAGSRA
jgi:hypothetical protein